MKALIIINQQYRDEEYDVPKKILEEAGTQVTTASTSAGRITGKLGGTTQATLGLSEVNVADYDVIIFVGGPGAVAFQHDVQAHLTAQEAINQNKLVAAICIAPTILAFAGVLDGKKATAWNDDGKAKQILEKNGATFTGDTLTVDENIVTANGPKAAEEFGKKIVEKLR